MYGHRDSFVVESRFHADKSQIPESCRCSNRSHVPHAAWAAIFIDPRSCRHVNSLAEACGIGFDTPASIVSQRSNFWDITDETTRLRSGRKRPTASKPLGPSSVSEETPLAPSTPAAEILDENETTSNGESEDGSDIEVLHTDVSEALETAEQLVAQFLEEPPAPELFVTSNSLPGDQGTLPSPLLSEWATSHEEMQSSEEDAASTSNDDASGIESIRSKKPYCSIITSNHHKEHSKEVSLSQDIPAGYSPPVTGQHQYGVKQVIKENSGILGLDRRSQGLPTLTHVFPAHRQSIEGSR